VTIIARDLPPGAITETAIAPTTSPLDSQDWASPWAGFNWCSFAPLEDKETQSRDRATFIRWKEMVDRREVSRETMELVPFTSTTKGESECWFEDLVPDVSD
jgi:D-amino-acid oxidase